MTPGIIFAVVAMLACGIGDVLIQKNTRTIKDYKIKHSAKQSVLFYLTTALKELFVASSIFL